MQPLRENVVSALDRVDWKDSLSYPREMYGIPAKAGGRIEVDGHGATILYGDGQYLIVKFDAESDYEARIHPTWRVRYLDA